MRFQVPQFIEIEDKIIGPFTFKQFAYMAGGAGASFIVYKLLPIYISVFIFVPVLALSAALAFYKVNNKPFIYVLEAAVKYFFQSKLFVWKREEKKKEVKKEEAPKNSGLYVPKLSENKLKELSWSLDINESLQDKTKENNNIKF